MACIALCDVDAMTAAAITDNALDDLPLVGGTTRLRRVATKGAECF